MVGVILAGQGVQIYGTDHQKNLHLQSILDATQLWCQLFSEPESGSDLGSLRTTAEPDGDGWVVNGQKYGAVEAVTTTGEYLWPEQTQICQSIAGSVSS